MVTGPMSSRRRSSRMCCPSCILQERGELRRERPSGREVLLGVVDGAEEPLGVQLDDLGVKRGGGGDVKELHAALKEAHAMLQLPTGLLRGDDDLRLPQADEHLAEVGVPIQDGLAGLALEQLAVKGVQQLSLRPLHVAGADAGDDLHGIHQGVDAEPEVHVRLVVRHGNRGFGAHVVQVRTSGASSAARYVSRRGCGVDRNH